MPPRRSSTGRCCISMLGDRNAVAQRLLGVLRTGGDVRRHKIRRIRAAIRAGTYENRLKLEVAVERMIGSIAG